MGGFEKHLQREAINKAFYVRKRCSAKTLKGKTSYEIWKNTVPDVIYCKVLGCIPYCLNNQTSRFSAKSKKGIFVGYSDTSKVFRGYFLCENRIITSGRVKCFEEYSDKHLKVGQLKAECFHEIK